MLRKTNLLSYATGKSDDSMIRVSLITFPEGIQTWWTIILIVHAVVDMVCDKMGDMLSSAN